MNKIPKFTAPEVKFIRTLEGALVIIANIILVVTPIVTNSLSPATAVKYGALIDIAAIGSRSLLKAIMSIGRIAPDLNVNVNPSPDPTPQPVPLVAESKVQTSVTTTSVETPTSKVPDNKPAAP